MCVKMQLVFKTTNPDTLTMLNKMIIKDLTKVKNKERELMSKEKLQYNNITPVQVGGQTKYRFSYKGADNKIKYITRKKSKDSKTFSG